jgi:hypothetical protein
MPANHMFRGVMLTATMLATSTFVFALFRFSGDGASVVAGGQLMSKMVHSFTASIQNEDQFDLQVHPDERSALLHSLRNYHMALQENANTIAINQRIDGIHLPDTAVQLPAVSKTVTMLTNNCWLNELYSTYTGLLASYKESKGTEYVEGPTTIWTTAYANAETRITTCMTTPSWRWPMRKPASRACTII